MTDTDTAATITPTEFAELVGSDPKTVRRFLRDRIGERVGKGGRWEIEANAVQALAEAFEARSAKSRTVTLSDLDDEADEEVDELDDLDDEDES